MRSLWRGLVAGAAGTTALNLVTYVDMAIRARPASTAPEDAVDAVADRLGQSVPGSGEEQSNRRTGLGALSGIATGLGVGALLGVSRSTRLPVPPWLGGALAGAAAMAATDLSMTRLGVTDPRSWDRSAWLSDAIPHLAYGVITWTALSALQKPKRK
jgi:hypothetical protein